MLRSKAGFEYVSGFSHSSVQIGNGVMLVPVSSKTSYATSAIASVVGSNRWRSPRNNTAKSASLSGRYVPRARLPYRTAPAMS
jgi:hypothetical protein